MAFMVFAGAATYTWIAFRGAQDGHPELPPARTDPFSDLPAGWSELAALPEVRSAPATAWTGSELMVWGGDEFGGASADPAGFRFDVIEGRWRSLPQAPIVPRSFPASAWTGSEFIVWGGRAGPQGRYLWYDDGAAFDPTTGRWRTLPPAPIEGRSPMSVWTGDELIVWGNQDRERRLANGAAYDPARDRWRPIAEGPLELTDGTTVWTGEEMIVFGAALNGANAAETPTAVGAAYDPARDSWRTIRPSTLSPQAHTAAWVNGEMVAVDYEQGTAAYDPGTDRWRALGDVPLRFYECSPQSVVVDGFVLADFCGATAVFATSSGRWHDTARPDLLGWGTEIVAAGTGFLLMTHSGETGDRRMLAFNPIDGFRCAGTQHVDPNRPGDAAYVVDRFMKMRMDDAGDDIGGIVSDRGASIIADPGSGLEPLLGGYYHLVWDLVSVQPLSGANEGFEVSVRMLVGLRERVVEEIYVLSPGRNVHGQRCPLVIDGGRPM